MLATGSALPLGDYTVTEAGFGADLGAEKFLDIKCRYAGIAPSACVLVATVRALKSHGGVAKADLNQPNLEAVKAGASNLIRHIDNLKNGFGLPVVVAINAFPTDTAEEQAYVEQVCAEQGVPCVLSEVFAKGGEGGKATGREGAGDHGGPPLSRSPPLEMPLKDKINAIATKFTRARQRELQRCRQQDAGRADRDGLQRPARVHRQDPVQLQPTTQSSPVPPPASPWRCAKCVWGCRAGFVVVICGNIMTMPGLPKKPAALGIDVETPRQDHWPVLR